MPISYAMEHRGWRYESGPNGAESAYHRSGHMVRSIGGGTFADRYLLWSPAIHGPDDTSTCKYRKPYCFEDGKAIVFSSLKEGALYYHNHIERRGVRRIRIVRSGRLR